VLLRRQEKRLIRYGAEHAEAISPRDPATRHHPDAADGLQVDRCAHPVCRNIRLVVGLRVRSVSLEVLNTCRM
jgi:hypothetical protein